MEIAKWIVSFAYCFIVGITSDRFCLTIRISFTRLEMNFLSDFMHTDEYYYAQLKTKQNRKRYIKNDNVMELHFIKSKWYIYEQTMENSNKLNKN